MSYKKEIEFLRENPYQILHVVIGKWIEREGDYNFADERFSSKITERDCHIMTNLGRLDFQASEINTKYEEYDGESNQWEEAKHKDEICHYIHTKSETKKIIGSDQYDLNSFLECIESKGHLIKGENIGHCRELIGDEDLSYDNKELLTLFCLPNPLLEHLITSNYAKFEGLDAGKLKELNKALNNTSNPQQLLEKISRLPETSQINSVHYAMEKLKTEVDNMFLENNQDTESEMSL